MEKIIAKNEIFCKINISAIDLNFEPLNPRLTELTPKSTRFPRKRGKFDFQIKEEKNSKNNSHKNSH
jgi:hypothetical protein